MLAIEALSWMELRNLSEQHALSLTAKQLGLEDREALGLAYKMIHETTRKKNLIDSLIRHALAPESLDGLELGVQSFLRLYVNQIKLGKGRLEDAARAADIGRQILGWRTLQRVEEALGKLYGIRLDAVLTGVNDVDKTAYQTFHHPWYVRYCFRSFGRATALKILGSSNMPPPCYICLNTVRGDEDNLLRQIETDGVRLRKETELRYTYRVAKSSTPITKIKSFTEGLFTFEDKSSGFAVEAAQPSQSMSVLALCSRFDGKITHLAQMIGGKGKIIVADDSKRKLARLKKETERLNIKNVYLVVIDANAAFPINATLDMVFLNPPSSQTGLLGKMPHLKWRLTLQALRSFAEKQWQTLNAFAPLVRKGGVMFYHTYSLAVEENEAAIERFIKWHPEFKLTPIAHEMGQPGLRGLDYCRRLYPHLDECLGLFAAKLVKEP